MKIILTIALHGSVEISETRCSGYREAITTWIGSVEQEYYKACTGIICEKLYGLVQFLQSYDLQIVTFFIRSDRCEVGMNIQSFDPFWSNPTIHISKLVSIYRFEDHHFQSPDFLNFFYIFFEFWPYIHFYKFNSYDICVIVFWQTPHRLIGDIIII